LERAIGRRHGPHAPEDLRDLLARDFLKAALAGAGRDDLDGAREAVRKASLAFPLIWAREGTLRETVSRFLALESVTDPISYVETLFRECLPKTRSSARARARLLSELHVREVFEGARSGNGDRIDGHWLAGIRLDPRWARNRGFWAIVVRRLVRRHGGALVRAHPTWFSWVMGGAATGNRELADSSPPPGP
jgi:hypothetical protein